MRWLVGRYERYTAIIIAVYASVWLGCFLTLPGFYLDTYEMFAFGREMQLGYWKHPPLPAWLAEAGFLLTGGWPQSQYVLSVGAVVVALVYLFRLTRDIAGAQLALIAVGLTMVNYYFTRPIETLNHNIVQLPLWVIVTFHFRRAFVDERWRSWLVLGLSSAALVYAKYTGVLLLGLLAAFALFAPAYRRRLASPGPWVAVSICMLGLAPHIFWLVQNDFLPFRYPFESTSRLSGPVERVASTANFLLAQIAFHLGMLLITVIGLVGWGRHKAVEIESKAVSVDDRWLVVVSGLMPLVIVALSSLWSGSSIRPEVGGSLVALSGLVIVVLLPRPVRTRWPRLAAALCAILAIGAPIGWVTSLAMRVSDGDVPQEMVPDRVLSAAMEEKWLEATGKPLSIVIGHSTNAAAVALYSRSRPSVMIEFNYAYSPWITPERLDREGALAIWRENGKWDRRSPAAAAEIAGDRRLDIGAPFELRVGEAVLTYGWAIIHPRAD